MKHALPGLIALIGMPETVEAQASDAGAAPLLTLEAGYTADMWSNVRGGLQRGSAYLDNLDLIATLDAEQALGLQATTFSIAALYNNRATFSDEVGDLQTVSNIDADGSLRLYEAWMERVFDSASLKLGLMDLNAEFDAKDTAALFINSSHGIGPDISQVGETGPAIFPLTGLGVRAHFDIGPRLGLRIGAFEGTPGDPERPRNTTLRLDSGEGALLIAEASQQLSDRGRVAVGAWKHTSRLETAADLERSERHNLGVYAFAEGTLLRQDGRELDGFVRIGGADPRVHQIARYYGAGLVFAGPLLAGEDRDEQLGIAVAVAVNGSDYRAAQGTAGTPVDSMETAIELTYRIQVAPWLALQPDLQFVINPGTDPQLQDAFAIGVRFEWTVGKEFAASQ